MPLLCELFWLSAIFNFHIDACYIPGALNDTPDCLSCQPGYVAQLLNLMGIPVNCMRYVYIWLLSHMLILLWCILFSSSIDLEIHPLEPRLDAGITLYQGSCYAQSTKSPYKSHQKTYLDFCLQMSYALVPITLHSSCRYAVYLSDIKKLITASLPKYSNIVRLLHIETGLANPLANNWYLESIMRGIHREKGAPPLRKLDITPVILTKIRDLLNLGSPLHVVFWVACLTMFFGFFRKSNVLAPAPRFDPAKHLCRSDIIVYPWGLEVIIKWSKTLQFRERNVSVPLPYIKGHPLCPTTAVIHAFSLTFAATLLGPALTYPTLSGVQPLRYQQFVKMLRQFPRDIGLPAQMFVGHSFRTGGASFAMEAGLPGEIIMQLGQW